MILTSEQTKMYRRWIDKWLPLTRMDSEDRATFCRIENCLDTIDHLRQTIENMEKEK